jgi:hypothetical protein
MVMANLPRTLLEGSSPRKYLINSPWKGEEMSHRDEHIIIFEHRDFRGRHRHIFGQEANLNNSEDNTLNDRMSSFVVLSGTWTFFRHSNFVEQVGGRTFGPGQYESVSDFNIPNDAVSSLRAQ